MNSKPVGYRTVNKRFVSAEAYDDIAKELINVNWSNMYRINSCQEQANFLYCTIHDIVEHVAPMRVFKIKCNDKPWVTGKFKETVNMRNIAFAKEDKKTYNRLRNTVNRLSRELKKRYFDKKNKLVKDDEQ